MKFMNSDNLQLPELGQDMEVIVNNEAVDSVQNVEGDTFQEKLENLWNGIGLRPTRE